MNVISLFNGMGCLWLALDKCNIKVNKRYSSEIDKYANLVNDKNYPDTIQLGDITNWKDWNINWSKIDLIGAGSPCQGFSFAGKGLNFNDERSKLFFIFIDILNHVKSLNPNVKYLFENVFMKYEHELVISRLLNINPIKINSALVSAQNRQRNYWTNINNKPIGLFNEMVCTIPQPEDKGILLKDILESNVDEKYFLTQKALEYVTNEDRMKKGYTTINGDKGLGGGVGAKTGLYLISKSRGFNKGSEKSIDNKCQTLLSNSWEHNNHLKNESRIRRLTPIECERLQSVPDNYTNFVSNSQRYKMLGNGWTVDVIAHILSFLNNS